MWFSMVQTYIFTVDEVDMDTSGSMESSSKWIQAIKAWVGKQLQIKKYESKVEEGVDPSSEIKVLWFTMCCYRGGGFLSSFNIV